MEAQQMIMIDHYDQSHLWQESTPLLTFSIIPNTRKRGVSGLAEVAFVFMLCVFLNWNRLGH